MSGWALAAFGAAADAYLMMSGVDLLNAARREILRGEPDDNNQRPQHTAVGAISRAAADGCLAACTQGCTLSAFPLIDG